MLNNNCECGCGGLVKPGNRFINGHNRRDKKHSEKTIELISVALTGVPKSPEHKVNLKKAMNDPKVKTAISVALIGVLKSSKHIAAIAVALTGRTLSSEHKTAIKEGMNQPDVKAAMSASHTGVLLSPEHCAANSFAGKKRWENLKYRENQLKAIFKGSNLKPNRPEKLLLKLLNKLFPKEWKYVGDGSLLIGYKNPDFINEKQKKIIEHFGVYHHGEEKTGISNEQHAQERINLFAKFGYQTLVIWEYELEDLDKLIERILKFNLV